MRVTRSNGVVVAQTTPATSLRVTRGKKGVVVAQTHATPMRVMIRKGVVVKPTPATPRRVTIRKGVVVEPTPATPLKDLCCCNWSECSLWRQLEEQKEEAKRAKWRQQKWKDKIEEADCEAKAAADFQLEAMEQVLAKYGGLSRFTVTSNEWHEHHKDAANVLFGFKSWSELKVYVAALFPDIDVMAVSDVASSISTLQNNKQRKILRLTPFEHCLATKMFFHCMPVRSKVAKIFGTGNSQIGKILEKWAPRWGKAGEQLSILIITDDYLKKDLPDEYRLLDFANVAALFDGKDFLIQVKRTDDKMRRTTVSSKMGMHAAAREITWVTPSGLCFEYTKLVGLNYNI